MLKKFVIYIGVMFTVVSCYKLNEPKKPKNLIPQQEMVNILIDLRLISSANGTNKKILDSLNIEAETYIYNKYKIDSLQFAESNNYYAFHIEKYEDIYKRVKDSLEALGNFYKELEKKEEAEKKKQDSLNLIAKDSLKGNIIKDNSENGLIEPVSDIDAQSQ